MSDPPARPIPPASRTWLGIAFIIAASLIVPVADGLVKIISGRYPALELVFLRYGLQTLLMLPIVLVAHGLAALRPSRPVSQALRALFIAGGAFCFFSAVRTIPLADAVAVFFVQPCIVTALAPVVLGERVGPWRWCAVISGFIGALIIIQPGFAGVDVGTLYALGAGTCFALFILTTRLLAGSDPPLVTNFLTGLGVTVLVAPAMPFVWTSPSQSDWVIILSFGTLGMLFSLCIVLAYEFADASTLAPFSYIELVAAVAVGYLMFGDFPTPITWLGTAVIVASGMVIIWRETVRRDAGARTALTP